MLKADYDVILDLVTDTSDSTVNQLVKRIKKNLNGKSTHCINVLSKHNKTNPFSEGRLFVSENTIDALFKTKNAMDDAQVTDFVLVTSVLMKKYWETICLHTFSSVHTWAVLGVDVANQLVDIQLPNIDNVEKDIKEYLQTVGNPKEVKILRSKTIPDDMFNAGFHERYGGVTHHAPMASLNMLFTVRKPDPLIVIKENRRRLAEAAGFDPDSLHVAKAEHDKRIWIVGKAAPPKFDGVVTNIPGVTVAAPGADCCMILLADIKTGACGAVHSGWLGTTKGAVRSCLQTMVIEFGTDPIDVHAAIGPSIAMKCFRLSAEAAAPLTNLDPTITPPVNGCKGTVYADLVTANVLMLEKDGVLRENIDTEHAYCTVCDTRFFSYGRDQIPFGNQIGFISCRKPAK